MRYSGHCGGCHQLMSFETDAEGNGTIPAHGSKKRPCSWIGKAVEVETPVSRAERERLALERALEEARRRDERGNRERLQERVDTRRLLRQEAMLLGLLACVSAVRAPQDVVPARGRRRFPVPR